MAYSENNPYKKAAESAPLVDFGSGPLGSNRVNQFRVEADKWEAEQQKKAEEEKLKAPPIDPRFQQLVEGQRQHAKEYRNRIPQLADTFMGQIAEVNKKNLAAEIDQTQKNYNKRGLLYSTARVGAEGDARTRSAQDLATKRYDVNKQLEDQADQLDQQAIDSGFALASQGQQLAGQDAELQSKYLDVALQRQQQDMAGLANLTQGIMGGAAYAGGYGSGRSNGTGGYQPSNPVNYGGNMDPKFGGMA